MNTVLVTGAHGFLGRNVSLEFKRNGYEVAGIGLGQWENDNYKEYGIGKWIESPVSLDALKDLGRDFRAIVHCAGSGSVGYSISNPADDFRMNVLCALEVMEYMRLYCKGAVLIYPSSAAVYGRKDDASIKETDDLAPASPYGYHKKIAEDLCKSYAVNFGLGINIVRLFSLYGEGLAKQLIWDACNKFSGDEREVVFWGTGEETRDWIHVSDAASLIFKLSEMADGFRVYNGGSGHRVTNAEVLNLIAGEFGKGQVVSFNGEARPGDPKYYLADISKAAAHGWSPRIRLSDGIKDYVKWFMKR